VFYWNDYVCALWLIRVKQWKWPSYTLEYVIFDYFSELFSVFLNCSYVMLASCFTVGDPAVCQVCHLLLDSPEGRVQHLIRRSRAGV